MSFTLRHANVNQFDPQSQRLQTIATTAHGAGVATFNEVALDDAAIAALLGFSSHTVGGNSVAWRTDAFKLVAKGSKTVMLGGRRGTGAPGDKRRRGPSRNVVWVVLEENASQREVLIFTHHAVAKADTTAKWRRALRALGFRNVGAEIARVMRLHPSAEVVGTGDLNTMPRVDYPGIPETEVASPATFGGRRYDRIHTVGAKVTGVGTFLTRSDHRGLQATVTLGAGAIPPAAHVTPPPKPVPPYVKAGRPVPFPWRAKWNPRRLRRQGRLDLAARVAAWRRKHPRRRR